MTIEGVSVMSDDLACVKDGYEIVFGGFMSVRNDF